MPPETQSRPAREARTGQLESVLLGGNGTPGSANSYATQAENLRNLAAVAAARRELLRDFVFEAAVEAGAYLGAIQNFVAADDAPGLKYSSAKFVAYAREVARGCKELTAFEREAAP
ncbi:MAG TPA: hypothetical protein VHT02_08715 [Methylocella sp.]|jgi:hypothetical protein|nr:hypothetical protein [Methylocella sp.]